MMSDRSAHPSITTPAAPSRRGQALVETALMLPLILILLMGAIDFGRLFFSWVSLHQAARIAANHASIDPTTEAGDIPTIIAHDLTVMGCLSHETPVLEYTRAGSPVAKPELGDYAEVRLGCTFDLLTPLSDLMFGDDVPMQAVAAFPVRTGCLDCGSAPGGNPPPPPPEQCRTVPDVIDMSVAGARLAWEAAGFIPANFAPTTGQDTGTVEAFSITTTDASCTSPQAIFNASVTVVVRTPDAEPPGCEVVPNVIGMTIADARAAWSATSFPGAVDPPEPDADPAAVVTAQAASQDGAPVDTSPGVTCLDPLDEPPVDLELEVGAPWPEPPAVPCQVPHMIDKQRGAAEGEWTTSGFAASAFSPDSGNFKVKWQSLVGLSWVPCESSITVSQTPP